MQPLPTCDAAAMCDTGFVKCNAATASEQPANLHCATASLKLLHRCSACVTLFGAYRLPNACTLPGCDSLQVAHNQWGATAGVVTAVALAFALLLLFFILCHCKNLAKCTLPMCVSCSALADPSKLTGMVLIVVVGQCCLYIFW